MNPSQQPPLLDIRELSVTFPIRKGLFSRTVGGVQAVSDVSLTLDRGEVLGLVGESGCGKSTLARTILMLQTPTKGQRFFDGLSLDDASPSKLRQIRRRMQVIFQDPYASLNPRLSVMEIVTEGLVTHGLVDRREREKAAASLLAETGLSPDMLHRYPHEFSGGQRQRISIARAIAMRPSLVVCDEPISALDVSIQSQILNLLMELRERLQLSYLFISHDLSVVRHIADRVAVMYLGRLVETGRTDDVMRHPRHPYTRALIAAIPVAGAPRREKPLRLPGDVPSPANPPCGCPFHPRCSFAQEHCRDQRPNLEPVSNAHPSPSVHQVACWRHEAIKDTGF